MTSSSSDNDNDDEKAEEDESILSRLTFRPPTTPEDIAVCYAIESVSYPADEAASLESLTNRQAHAGEYFQCAVLEVEENNVVNDIIIGFVCATRCQDFEDEDSMSTHDPKGRLLAIHSVVVHESYRRQGIATKMLTRYLETIHHNNNNDNGPTSDDDDDDDDDEYIPIQSIVLLAKAHLLGFYVNCGFQVNRPSPIVHGQELWYELERKLEATQEEVEVVRSLPFRDGEGEGGESWFCKTEQFRRPFPEVKPHLEAHKEWVADLRQKGYCITSGYRVDAEGKPGGGGLLFFAAKNYAEALALVQQDPLVANDCVDWELNGWIGQVGDIQMR